MNFVDSIILGFVEGITEFLPISSTGHLILVSTLLKLENTDFLKSFEIIIQSGAIISVIVLYWRRFLIDHESLKRILVAFLPTGVLGLIFYKIIKNYLGNNEVVLWSMLLGGVALVVFEIFHKESEDSVQDVSQISYKQSFAIGLFQSVAMIPGVSRSAATILGGLSLGLSRKTIVEFSFLLAVVTMAAATGLDLLNNFQTFSADQLGVLSIAFITSFLVAIMSIKFLLSFIKTHSFIGFGIYRILAAILFWIFILR